MSEARRPLFWEGSSKKDFKEFPVAVQKDMGVALFVAQLGRTAASAKPWKGLGSGVYELVEDHRGDTFRAVYVVQVADAVHVLHAFQKKSKTGIATPQSDVELVEKRLKAVLATRASPFVKRNLIQMNRAAIHPSSFKLCLSRAPVMSLGVEQRQRVRTGETTTGH